MTSNEEFDDLQCINNMSCNTIPALVYTCNFSNRHGSLYYIEINTANLVQTTKDKESYKFLHVTYTNKDTVDSSSQTSDDKEFSLILKCHVKTCVKIYCNTSVVYNFDTICENNALYCEEIIPYEFKNYLKMYDIDYNNHAHSFTRVIRPDYDPDELFSDFCIKYQYSYESMITVRIHKDLLLYELTTKSVDTTSKKYVAIVDEYVNKFPMLLKQIYFDSRKSRYFDTLTTLTLNHKYRLMRIITPDKYQYMLFEFKYLPTKIITVQDSKYVYFTTLYIDII